MSTQFTVSVQTLLLVAIFDDRKVTSEMISGSTGCNPVMVRQIFGKLKNAGILHVSAGRGATTLARDPGEISLWDIYMAVEGYSVNELFKFHPNISNGCQIGWFFREILGVHLDGAVQAMGERMAAVSLAQLIREWQAVRGDGGKAP